MEQTPAQDASPRVSVILVSRNNAPAIRACLESLERSANRPELEILLVDNGSLDDCPRLDAEFPSLHLHRLPRNFGMVKALNIAMRTARGEFFLILQPPALVDPGTIPALLAKLEEAGAAAICPLAVSPEGRPLTRIHPLPLPNELFRACNEGDFADWAAPPADRSSEVDFFHPPILLVRAYFLKAIRFLDERYGEHWWDLEICTHLRKAGKQILLLPSLPVRLAAEERQTPPSPAIRALLAADRFLGAAVWTGKHYGAWQGWKFRLRALARVLSGALLSLVTFRDTSFRLALLADFVTGQKIDGSQRGL